MQMEFGSATMVEALSLAMAFKLPLEDSDFKMENCILEILPNKELHLKILR